MCGDPEIVSTQGSRPEWWTDQPTRHARAVAEGLESYEKVHKLTQWDRTHLERVVAERREVVARRAGLAGTAALRTRPVVTKAQLRSNLDALVTGAVEEVDYLTVRTSGTTGVPTRIHHSDAYLVERVAQRMRMLDAYGLPWHPRTLIITAKPGAPVVRFGTPAGGSAGLSIAVNVSALDRGNRSYVAELVNDFLPDVVAGQSMELLALAEVVQSGLLEPPPAEVAVAQGDVLTAEVRHVVEEACRVRLYDTYGLQETGQVAFECPQVRSSYHVNAEAVDLEIDESGLVLLTSLVNDAISLIRYESGDRVSFGEDACPCGRALPVLTAIAGRARPLIRGADGRRSQVTRLQTAVSAAYGEVWQIQHDRPGLVLVRAVRAAEPQAHERLLREARDLYDVEVHVEASDLAALLTPAGKLERYQSAPSGESLSRSG